MEKPGWLQGLMDETFFRECGAHVNIRKNEKNIFCLQCCVSFCTHCLPSHLSHPLLQVRRYVYHDVIRLADLEKLIDCSCIQTYTINGAKVIFLNERPQTRPCHKVATNICFTCDRILQHPFNFCSLSCKVNLYEYQGIDLSNILLSFKDSDLYEYKGLRILDGNGTSLPEDPTLLEEDSSAMYDEHGSTASMRVPNNMEQENETAKKKNRKQRSNEWRLPPPRVQSPSNRRKGAPHRSPLA